MSRQIWKAPKELLMDSENGAKKFRLISWEDVMSPKKWGGLGVEKTPSSKQGPIRAIMEIRNCGACFMEGGDSGNVWSSWRGMED